MRKMNSLLVLCLLLPALSLAQSVRRTEYGVNLNLAIYQFDDVRSKETREVLPLRQTASSAEEEIDQACPRCRSPNCETGCRCWKSG